MKSIILILTLVTTFSYAEMVHSESSDIVLDIDNNLMWQDQKVTMSWDKVIDYCRNLSLAGFDDWQLPPNYTLLKRLYPNKESFHKIAKEWYWSLSAPDVLALVAVYNGGTSSEYAKYVNYHVSCARNANLTFTSLSSLLSQNELISNDKIELTSSSENSIEYLIQQDGKKYLGTKTSLLTKIGSLPSFSTIPFKEDIPNSYLSIAMIPLPVIPKPLKLEKDEFESKAEFTERIKNKNTERELEILKLQEKYRKDVEARNTELENRVAFIKAKKHDIKLNDFRLVMGEPKLSNPIYDSETNTMFVDIFLSNGEWHKKVGVLLTDKEQARTFKQSVNEVKPSVIFNYENGLFGLQSVEMNFNKQKYIATLTDTNFKPEHITVTLENKKIALNELQNPNLEDKYQVYALGYTKGLNYNNDLETLVKDVKQAPLDPKKWLFAISIEKYDEADPVIYATNSANSFISVMQKRLGIDKRHTYELLNEKATTGGIKGGLERLLQNVQPGDSIYFYYSGHGIPDPVDGEPYILPRDVIADYVVREKDLMARSIYKKLSDSSAARVVAFVDSCYSGRTDGISNIKGTAAGHFKTKQVEFDTSKMAVFTAGTNGQFSNAFPEKGNRLFSYYLTKAIATKENLDIDTLSAEVYANVKEESLKMGDIKRQEPQVEGNIKMGLK